MSQANGSIAASTPLEGAIALVSAKMREWVANFCAMLMLEEDEERQVFAVIAETLAPEARLLPYDDAEEIYEDQSPLPVVKKYKTRIQRYKTVHTIAETEKRFHLTHAQAIRALYYKPKHAKKASKPKQKRAYRPALSEDLVAQIKDAWASGEKATSIMERLGVSHQTVYKYKNKNITLSHDRETVLGEETNDQNDQSQETNTNAGLR